MQGEEHQPRADYDVQIGVSMASSVVLSIVTPIFDSLAITKECIEAVQKNTDVPYEHILVNNHPPENQKGYAGVSRYIEDTVDRDPRMKLLDFGKNIGCFAAINEGFKIARGQYLCKLDNDTIVSPKWSSKMIHALEKIPELAYLSSYLDKDMQNWVRERKKINGVEIETLPHSMVTMSCCIFPRKSWDNLGPWPEEIIKRVYGKGEGYMFNKVRRQELLIAHYPGVVCSHRARSKNSNAKYGDWKLQYCKNKTDKIFNEWVK
jgi:glycosyltransferase involved in cell wall biosynthesis